MVRIIKRIGQFLYLTSTDLSGFYYTFDRLLLIEIVVTLIITSYIDSDERSLGTVLNLVPGCLERYD